MSNESLKQVIGSITRKSVQPPAAPITEAVAGTELGAKVADMAKMAGQVYEGLSEIEMALDDAGVTDQAIRRLFYRFSGLAEKTYRAYQVFAKKVK